MIKNELMKSICADFLNWEFYGNDIYKEINLYMKSRNKND